MKVEKIKIEKLIPYQKNPRKNKKAILKVAESLREYGFRQPIVVDESMVILAGHTRLEAAKRLKMKAVPVHVASDLTGDQKKAYRIMDNRSAQESEWDMDLLTLELKDLNGSSFDLSLTGFDQDELAGLLSLVNEGLTDEDAVPDLPEEPTTKLGDLWILGEHRLLCGDSTSIDAVDKLMDGNKADMVFTDPPYGVSYQSNMRTKSKKFDVLTNDDQLLDITPIIEVFSTGWVFVWTTWKVIDKWIDNTSAFGYPNNVVIWSKGGGGIGDLKKTFSTDYEMALVWNRGNELCGKRIGSVWKVDKDKAIDYKHPTQKPVALAVEAFDKTTKHGQSILDLFLGSGSTLIAAEKTNRKCYGMELDPKYCDVIIQRWEEFTGNKAELTGG
jgi:DNA modification methylase